MAIINVTPDSFSDGGTLDGADAAIARGIALAEAGASIIDVGGESTRPGAEPTPVGLELERVLPVIEGLAGQGLIVSIDTRNAVVMRAAVDAGASILNDVSGFASADNAAAAAELGVALCIMHMQGTPATMQMHPHYDDAPTEIAAWLHGRADQLVDAGIDPTMIAIDPGIGFGKTLEHNLAILSEWHRFEVRYPSLLGASRKGFIRAVTGETDPTKRVPGSIAAALQAFACGCRLFRVHDVAETRQALAIAKAIGEASDRPGW